ncbi:4-hydroxythreonine-4-phosphate dehydrogenase PdxA [Acetobacter orleanensis]|uniref:4-hydroxythreonine-4-phosphate dehydrogenase n=1 Tax=Acetobacter orleanensis TaxID=104099 RepID=A0A4Y3TNI5_9PROT|nr:4-hydroxythreonine-4-phosphate dehydrogenase PdxA [Acetobacter orleanensis]KXV66744.1 4-hydroxythreonine-4-phosphate dehydrogenase [Acetobacter orleanensis]PCD78774.1 4-hydroxythreonine-4-phosphate dehydrogenase PdxA [Acetobacter orleanensis]GAN69537.1 pyridoxal phosphate (vitamin B6) biosynthetic, 4-hydroxythreonine-4-phosphate dehydrogenase PdxA [Acetobacter orleanensis JCM 7639]GBR23461.1 pyridoxal phosphate biosynthetic protein PdxA [Acetobacter orleanensis NRIC 0473]GEB83906.1 4-hydrox
MLVLTQGDPAGIGPEITVKAWEALRETGPSFVFLGDPTLLDAAAPVRVVGTIAEARNVFQDAIPVLPLSLAAPVTPGMPDSRNAGSVIESITQAVRLVQKGQASAVVTNPISKDVVKQAGFTHPGHTGYLAELCGVPGQDVMMLAGPSLRVVPVTVHVALRKAIEQLTPELIIRTARTTVDGLKRNFGLSNPRVAVAGLNPHAGEGGLMGREELECIIPAIRTLQAEGVAITGPLPPDTMFTPEARARYDVALCMYHDQGLIPLKTLDMAEGVNITLGLPIIRTSPDHGTAFDIAGTGKADAHSLLAALRLAATLVENRRNAS